MSTTEYIERARDNAEAHLDQAQLIKRQWDEAMAWFNNDRAELITCCCGRRFGLEFLFRCYHCGVWFCESCAKHHFGKDDHHGN